MSRGRSRRRLLAALAGIVVSGAIVVGVARPAAAGNSVEFGPTTITVTIPIDVFFGTPELVNRWGPAITQYWNPEGQGAVWCGLELIITTDMRSIQSLDEKRPGSHLVQVVESTRPGQFLVGSIAPYVEEDPRQYAGTAWWPAPGGMPDDAYDALIGSNASAFLGAGILFEGESPVPDIVDAHGIEDTVDCRLQVRHEAEWSLDTVIGPVHNIATLGVAFEMLLDEDPEGQLRGRAEGTARVEGTFDDSSLACTGVFSGSDEYSVEVTGTRDGDEVRVSLPPGLMMQWATEPGNCPADSPFITNVSIPYLTDLEGVLDNGRYRHESPPTSFPGLGDGTGMVIYRIEMTEQTRRVDQ